MAENSKMTSRYARTPIKNFYLDIWDPVDIAPTLDDTEVVLDPKYHERPDLLANDLYGTPRLWWIFACRNADILVDPIADFKSGTIIYAPAMKSVERFA